MVLFTGGVVWSRRWVRSKKSKNKMFGWKKRNCRLKRRSERYKLWMNGEWLWRSFTSPNSRATIYFILFLFLSLIVVGSSLSIRIQIIITHEREEKKSTKLFFKLIYSHWRNKISVFHPLSSTSSENENWRCFLGERKRIERLFLETLRVGSKGAADMRRCS